MSVIHKTKAIQHLDMFQVWINDTNPTSTYFQVAQIPSLLTAGKNAFLINGTNFLVPTTEVLVEVLDSQGNIIFTEPIKNYQEGLARVVSIEIYDDTPTGLATLTILGHISSDVNGNAPPAQFLNAYNVKWQQKILVDDSQNNVTPIRLLSTPETEVSEILNPFRSAITSLQSYSSSLGVIVSGSSLQPSVSPNAATPNTYVLFTSIPFFIKDMEGGVFQAAVANMPFTNSIDTVVNNRTAFISPGIVSASIYLPFTTNDFVVNFTGSPQYTTTQYTQSFADIIVNHLTTFSGNIYRVKVFGSSIDSPGTPTLMGDIVIDAAEMLTTSSYLGGQPKLRTGYFTDNSVPTQYWIIDHLSGSTGYNPS